MKNTTPLILPFSEISARDLALVGGKGANLGEMTNAGFPVPAGFCLTTTAFRQFIATAPDAGAMYARLDGVRTDDAEMRIGRGFTRIHADPERKSAFISVQFLPLYH